MSWASSHKNFPAELVGRRVILRPLVASDFEAWRDVRHRSREWLTRWESKVLPGQPDPTEDRRVFAARCGARERERQLGNGYSFGIFVSGRFAGEINMSVLQRGPFQNSYVGYWIDEASAGHGYVPEAAVLIFRFAFEEIGLHRVQVAIIPRNGPSNRVAAKLGLRNEGTALRYLEINGVWEDHIRYAITAEDWQLHREDYLSEWIRPAPGPA
jgi:ribosomal-protein-alanine N-acetyltransferase